MKKSALLILTLFILAVLTISACGTGENSAALNGTTWKLVSYSSTTNPNTTTVSQANQDINNTLTFSKDGKLNGNVGCNSFSGNYVVRPEKQPGKDKVNSGQITFGAIASTLMACADPAMQQENAVFQVFSNTANFMIESGKLTITSANGKTSITFAQNEK